VQEMEEQEEEQDRFYSWRARGETFRAASLCGDTSAATATCYGSLCDLRAPCIRIHKDRITFAREGGEDMEEVRGQREDVEMPKYGQGWLTIGDGEGSHQCNAQHAVSHFRGLPDHLPATLGLLEATNAVCVKRHGDVAEKGEEPDLVLLIVMRYEYVNLYHTMTDWHNTVEAIDYLFQGPSSSSTPPVQVVFLDAHPRGSLDEMWEKLTGRPPIFISQLSRQTFERVIFVTPGYESPVTLSWKRNARIEQLPSPAMLSFQKFFLLSCGLDPNTQAGKILTAFWATQASRAELWDPSSRTSDCTTPDPKCLETRWVTVVFRGNYLPHPRSSGSISRRISNEQEVISDISSAIAIFPGWEVRGVHLEAASIETQVALFHSTDVLIGVHGAALSHTLFMRRGTRLLELLPPGFNRPHFVPMAESVGVTHIKYELHEGHGDGPYQVDAQRLADKVLSTIREMI